MVDGGTLSPSQFLRSIRAFRRNQLSVAGAIVLVLVILAGAVGPLLTPYGPADQDIVNRYKGPSFVDGHLLGTDSYGRDVLARTVYGVRTSLVIALLCVGSGLLVGVAVGTVAAFKGGAVDRAVTEVVNVLMSFPALLIGLIIVAIIGPGFVNVVISLSVVFTYRFIRLARSLTLNVRHLEYVEGARALGAADGRILVRYILPNIVGDLVSVGSLWIGAAILAAAGLSFLGIGVQPPTPSLGNMVQEGMLNITIAPWVSMFPGLAILVSVLGFNMVGDGVRDALDPKLRG